MLFLAINVHYKEMGIEMDGLIGLWCLMPLSTTKKMFTVACNEDQSFVCKFSLSWS
jgi:hypothetical protein